MPVEPTVSEITSTGTLGIGFSEEVVAFGGGELPSAEEIMIFETIMNEEEFDEPEFVEEEIKEDDLFSAAVPSISTPALAMPSMAMATTSSTTGGRRLAESKTKKTVSPVTVKIGAFTSTGIDVKLDFTNPLEVSRSGKPSKMKIKFKPNVFFSKKTMKAMEPNFSLEVEIPKQLPSKEDASFIGLLT